jgi:1,2-diacylglycerol 3-alpha-glucosyltransferase
MNIAFFTNNYKPFVGGVPIAIENLAETLRRRGHRVFIFAPEYDQPVEDERDVFRTWSIKNFNDSNFVLPIPLSLETYVHFSDTKADVVHCHHPFLLGETGLHAARASNLPVVFTYHTQYEKYAHYLPFDKAMVTELAQSVAVRFSNCCDGVIAPSTDVQKMLQERGVTTEIRVIPTGVDLGRFRDGRVRWLRNHLGIPDDDRIMLFVSRLAKEKNVEFLIDAFAKMTESAGNLRFVLVGSGEYESVIRERAESSGSGDRIHFTGTLSGPDLVSAYKDADIFAFASTTETQGMVVLEAMAGGLPVVAVDACGVRDVVQDGQNGYLIPEGDTEAFAESALSILKNATHRNQLRENAVARASEMSLMNTTRKVEDLYRWAARNRHQDREERFLLLREFVKYQFQKLAQGLESLLSPAA